MGVVYEAYDRHREVVVAIKKIRHLNSEGIYRLKKEFRALADLTHPNLVALYELFSGEDGYFFSMEYVAGVDFLTYVRGTTDRARDIGTHKSESMSTVEGDQPPPPQGGMQDVLATTEQVLPQLSEAQTQRLRLALAQLRDGVECLHRVNRLHCDIKPSNILVTPAGRLVLLDCGLTMDSGGDSNASGQRIAGTFPYMSPEQAEARRLSPASDWYAVGVSVYEAIVGIRPFVGTVFEVVLAKREREPVRPSLRISAVPNDLDDLCMRLLDRNPQTRASGRDIADFSQAAEPDPIGLTAPDMGARSLFVGRGQELGMLQAAFYQISTGQAVVAFVKGESGLGKTALVNHFLDDVRAVPNTVVLSGRCYERESVPFKALDDLMDELAKYLMRLPAIEAVQLLPRDVSILAKLFPGLLRVNAVANAPHRERTPLDQKELRLKAFAALRELLGRISDRANLVLAIDDLQWGDLDGVELLNNLLCPPDQPAMLLIVSYRSESENDSIIASLRSSPQIEMTGVSVRQIDLSPLDATEAKELALAFAKDSSEDAACFAEAVARESGGFDIFG